MTWSAAGRRRLNSTRTARFGLHSLAVYLLLSAALMHLDLGSCNHRNAVFLPLRDLALPLQCPLFLCGMSYINPNLHRIELSAFGKSFPCIKNLAHLV
jgi:hypothetical protein